MRNEKYDNIQRSSTKKLLNQILPIVDLHALINLYLGECPLSVGRNNTRRPTTITVSHDGTIQTTIVEESTMVYLDPVFKWYSQQIIISVDNGDTYSAQIIPYRDHTIQYINGYTNLTRHIF
jgi:hypothetical protein